MILLYKEDQGVVYTLDEFNELIYAPVYTDNTINLNEFDVVDIDRCEDEYEILDIQNELISLSNSLLQVKRLLCVSLLTMVSFATLYSMLDGVIINHKMKNNLVFLLVICMLEYIIISGLVVF